MYDAIKNAVKSRLSNKQKSLFRLCRDIAGKPKNTRFYLNRFRYSKTVLRNPEINFVPPVFVATITDNCNLRCPTCLYLLENPDKFLSSYITIEMFRQVLERYNRERKAEIIFLTGGEPLLHPDFEELIDICREYRASVKTSTNGILVKSRISSLLKLDYVNVSVDAYSYESFRKYRGGTPKQFDLIIEGLKALKDNRACFSMSYLLTAENLPDVDKMLAIAEEIKPSSVYLHNINPHGCGQYKPLIINDENTNSGIKKILSRADYPFDIYIPAVFDVKSEFFRQAKCVQPWHYFCFNSAGNIAYCCHLAHNAEIGNVCADYNFNSPKMLMFRRDIIKGKISKSCLYCQRRFMNKEFASFDSKSGKWFINEKN